MRSKLILIFLGIILSLVVGELMVRAVRPQLTITSLKSSYSFPCYRRSDILYILLKPNKRCILHSNAEAFDDTLVQTNSLGFRNAEIASSKSARTERVLFLGDSFTLGWGVSAEQTFAQKTGEIIQQLLPNQTIETINAAVNATGPTHQYLLLKTAGLPLEPDIVVVGFYPWNDVFYDLRGSEIVTSTDASGLPTSVDSTSLYVDHEGILRPKNLPLRLKIPLVRSSHLVNLVAQIIAPLRLSSENDLLPQLDSALSLTCLFKSACRDLDREKASAKELFLAMKKVTSERNIRLVVLLIPAEFQVNSQVNQKFAIPIPLTPSERAYPHEEFSRFFRENGIDVIDLLPPFLGNAENRTLYFPKDDHWTPAGHKVAAEAIAPVLKNILTGDASSSGEETEVSP